MKYVPLSYSSPTRSMPRAALVHDGVSGVLTGVEPAADRSEAAALVHAHDQIGERCVVAGAVVIRSPPSSRGSDDADGRGEREPVGPADEPSPALGAVVEVVEEMLDHPGEGPGLLAEIARLAPR